MNIILNFLIHSTQFLKSGEGFNFWENFANKERFKHDLQNNERFYFDSGDIFIIFHAVIIFLHSDLQTEDLVLIFFAAEDKEG